VRSRRSVFSILVALVLVVGLAACGSDDSDNAGASTDGGGGSVNLVAYSTPQQAYAAIIKAFNGTDAGKGVKVSESYGASGDQSRAVDSGQPADYVGFSLEPDISRLTKSGLVGAEWNQNATKGMVTNSVVVFFVRKGNPKNIETWEDLLSDDVEVLTPNVFTSGGARWNVMAAYGSQIEQGKSEAEATQYLHDLYANIPVQDASARESLQTFAGGKGDVLLGYENEAIFAQQKGEAIDYVVPEQTILIENPVAVITESANPDKAAEFITFLRTPEAQRVFGEKGYRSILPEVLSEFDYPTPSNLFTAADLGGWEAITTKFFDPNSGVVAQILQQ
jgi:sulfate/thiosulfate transport system substrate-binding protein